MISLSLVVLFSLALFILTYADKTEKSLNDINKKIGENEIKISDLRVGKTRVGVEGVKWEWKNNEGKLSLGNTRNVALRIDTFQLILDSFKTVVDPNTYRDTIKKTAKEIGSSFGERLQIEINSKKNYDGNFISPKSIQEKIEYWLIYDSDTGMGHFEVQNLIIFDERTIQCEFLIHNSFIADKSTKRRKNGELTAKSYENKENGKEKEENAKEGKKECIFFEGYLEGVLEAFVDVEVDVKETSCGVKKVCENL